VVTGHIPDQGFRVSSRDGVPVVTAPGEIDAANAEALGDALAAASADHPTIIVDMTRNVFCDSSGLRVLIMAVKRARAAGGELRLVLSQPHLRRVFTVTGLDRVIKISGTLAEAAP
jgi:anti-sigma B factor antagonist